MQSEEYRDLFYDVAIKINYSVRVFVNYIYYLFWLLIDPSKFKIIKTEKIKNLLVMHSGAVGDTYSIIGLMNRLSEKYPDVNIYYLTLKRNKKFIKSPKIKFIEIKEAKKLILSKNIDAAILFYWGQNDKELYDLEFFKILLKVPYRVSYFFLKFAKKTIYTQFIPPLVTRKIFNSFNFSGQVKAFKALGFDIDRPTFFYTEEGEEAAKKILKNYKINNKNKVIFLHPAGGTVIRALKEGKIPSHMWFPERWAKVADILIEKYNAKIILTGIKEESEVINEIYKRIKNKGRTICLVGKTKNVEEMASLLRRGDLLITIDTSVSHIGAQTDIPLIILFGNASPEEASPIAKKKINIFHPEACHLCKKYACANCFYKCMGAITVEEIINASEKLMTN